MQRHVTPPRLPRCASGAEHHARAPVRVGVVVGGSGSSDSTGSKSCCTGARALVVHCAPHRVAGAICEARCGRACGHIRKLTYAGSRCTVRASLSPTKTRTTCSGTTQTPRGSARGQPPGVHTVIAGWHCGRSHWHWHWHWLLGTALAGSMPCLQPTHSLYNSPFARPRAYSSNITRRMVSVASRSTVSK